MTETIKFIAQYWMTLIFDLSTGAVATKCWICAFFLVWIHVESSYSIHNTEEEHSSIWVRYKSVIVSARFAPSLHFCNISLLYQHTVVKACWDFTVKLNYQYFIMTQCRMRSIQCDFFYIVYGVAKTQMESVFSVSTIILDSNEKI